MYGSQRTVWAWGAAFACALVLAAGCDGGGGGGGVPVDLTGHWKMTAYVGAEVDLAFGAFEQTGDSVTGMMSEMAITGTVSGDTLTTVVGDEASGDYVAGTATASGPDELTGTFDFYEGGVVVASGTSLMQRFTPSGSFTALDSGTDLAGIDVTTTQYGCGRVEATGSLIDCVEVDYVTCDTVVRLRFHDNADALAVGTFTVTWSPSGSDEVDMEVMVASPSGSGSAGGVDGTLVVTKYDAEGMAADIDIDCDGDTVTDFTASFDVPWDVVTGSPFGP